MHEYFLQVRLTDMDILNMSCRETAQQSVDLTVIQELAGLLLPGQTADPRQVIQLCLTGKPDRPDIVRDQILRGIARGQTSAPDDGDTTAVLLDLR